VRITLDVEPEALASISEGALTEVRLDMRSNRLQAIKVTRELFGVSLLQAKVAVDVMLLDQRTIIKLSDRFNKILRPRPNSEVQLNSEEIMEKNREIKVVVDYAEENFRVEVMGESIVEETVEGVMQRVEEYLRQVT
jgi:hypothetical protein